MRYNDFENIMTPARMGRYVMACDGNTRKAMTLYRKNLQLTQELFTVIGCFEVALRNAIDAAITPTLGDDWLKTASAQGGVFDTPKCRITRDNIREAIDKLHVYSFCAARMGASSAKPSPNATSFGCATVRLTSVHAPCFEAGIYPPPRWSKNRQSADDLQAARTTTLCAGRKSLWMSHFNPPPAFRRCTTRQISFSSL
jgi:hypothetical protein